MGGEGRGGWDDSRSRSKPTNTRVSIRVTISEPLSQSSGRFFWRRRATDRRKPWLDNSRRIAPFLNSCRIAPVLNSRRAAPRNIRVTPSHSESLRVLPSRAPAGTLNMRTTWKMRSMRTHLKCSICGMNRYAPSCPAAPSESLQAAPSRSESLRVAQSHCKSRRAGGPLSRSHPSRSESLKADRRSESHRRLTRADIRVAPA